MYTVHFSQLWKVLKKKIALSIGICCSREKNINSEPNRQQHGEKKMANLVWQSWYDCLIKKIFRKHHPPFKRSFVTVDQNAVMLKLVCVLLAFIPHPISLLMGICFKLPLYTQNLFNFRRRFELSGVDCTHPLYSQWNLLTC